MLGRPSEMKILEVMVTKTVSVICVLIIHTTLHAAERLLECSVVTYIDPRCQLQLKE